MTFTKDGQAQIYDSGTRLYGLEEAIENGLECFETEEESYNDIVDYFFNEDRFTRDELLEMLVRGQLDCMRDSRTNNYFLK